MSRTSTSIPLDILEYIVDLAATPEELIRTRALSSFALTSRALLHFSRKHRFRNISITVSAECAVSNRAFIEIISASPQIAEYVCSLALSIMYPDSYYGDYSYQSELFSILKTFIGIRHLEIHGPSRSWSPANTLKEVDDALNDLVQIDTITSLTLDCIAISLFQARISPNLRYLNLWNFTVTGLNDAPIQGGNSQWQPPQLHHFCMDLGSCGATKKLLTIHNADNQPLIDFSCLSSLQASCSTEADLNAVQSILLRTSCLTSFTLTITSKLDFPDLSPLFAALTLSIATLQSMCFNRSVVDYGDPLLGLPNFLQGINRLPNVLGDFSVFLRRTCNSEIVGSTIAEDCRDLDNGLAALEWPHLKTVHIAVLSAGQSNIRRTDFPILSASKTILFKYN